MQIEYTNTEKDYKNFHKYLLLLRIRTKAAIHAVVITLLMIICVSSTLSWYINVSYFVALTAIYLFFIYLIPYYRSNQKLHRSIARDASALEPKTLSVTDEGLLIESTSKQTTWGWDSIKAAEANDKFIFITLADRRYMLFPKASFPSDAEAAAFLGLIQSRIYGLDINQFAVYSKPSKPPYLLGLLCIIPLIGAFAGVVYILLGIVKYKDKWFALIGVAGILWSVAIYGSLFWYSQHGAFPRQAMKTFAQSDLNNLVKQIEFYKIEHGVYPDSLQQLKTKDDFLSITDPTQSLAGSKKATYYNYKPVGSHYYLFSSGPDGVPNTADDIYPQLPVADSSKIGLIIRR